MSERARRGALYAGGFLGPFGGGVLTVLIPEFAGKNFIDYGLITAAGSIAIVVPALVVIFLNRYLVTGLLAGSVK